jgi:hypothetical protein
MKKFDVRRSGPTEKHGRATRVARDTHWTSKANGHLDGCPKEGARVPDVETEWPNGRCGGYPMEGGVSGVVQRELI